MLVGRAGELTALAERLQGDRPVALLGEPGIGKTALLRAAVAASGRDAFEGGAFATLSWMPYLPISGALGRRLPHADPGWIAGEVERRVGSGVLVLDDLHWADPATLALLPLLAPRIGLVCTVRRGDAGTEAALAALEAIDAEVIAVSPLDDAAAAELVRTARPDLGARMVQRVVERSGRNPLLLLELSSTQGEPSGSLRRAVAGRLRALPPEVRRAAGLLALAGRPLDETVLQGRAAELAAAGLATVTGGVVALRHALLAEAVVAELDEEGRRGLHAELARAVADPGEAARHSAEAGDPRRAHELAIVAAQAATSPGERVAHLRLAAVCADGAEADALRLEAARLLVEERETADVERLLTSVTDSSAPTRATVALLRAQARWWSGDPDGMRAAVSEGLAQVTAASREVEVRLRVQQTRLAVALDTVTAASLALAERTWRMARDAGVDEAEARSLLGAAHSFLGSPEAVLHLRAALATARAGGSLEGELRVAQTFVAIAESGGAQAEARAVATEMRRRAADARLTRWEWTFGAMLVNLDLHAGAYGAVVDGARALLGESVDSRLRVDTAATLIVALVDLGRDAEARQELAAALELAPPGKRDRWWYLWATAEADLWAGRPESACRQAEECLRLEADPSDLAFASVTRAWACVDLGRHPGPPAAVVDMPMVAAIPAETAALAALAEGRHGAAAEGFDEAADRFAPLHRRGELRCRWAAAEALRRQGDLLAARERLEAVEARVAEHGMEPLLGRVRRSLRLAGVRRAARRGAADAQGLTVRERQIVGLVGAGLSNVDIARRLGVSRSTVKAQLAAASNKLGASSRTHAAALLESR